MVVVVAAAAAAAAVVVVVVGGCLFNVPATCQCISGTYLSQRHASVSQGRICPSDMPVYLRDVSAQPIVLAATLRQKLRTKIFTFHIAIVYYRANQSQR